MAVDLTFIENPLHRRLIERALDEAYRDGDVIGLMLLGSFARGDASPGSDLDFYILLRNGCSRAFQSELRRGILVEYKYRNPLPGRSWKAIR